MQGVGIKALHRSLAIHSSLPLMLVRRERQILLIRSVGSAAFPPSQVDSQFRKVHMKLEEEPAFQQLSALDRLEVFQVLWPAPPPTLERGGASPPLACSHAGGDCSGHVRGGAASRPCLEHPGARGGPWR